MQPEWVAAVRDKKGSSWMGRIRKLAVTVLTLAQCAYISDDPGRKLAVALSGRENDGMASYSPHSLRGASSPSLPHPAAQGMAEESLAENQLAPGIRLTKREKGKAGFLQYGVEVSILKKSAAGGRLRVGWGDRDRDRDTDREMLDLHGWELVGSGVRAGQPQTTTSSFCDSFRWGLRKLSPSPAHKGFVAGLGDIEPAKIKSLKHGYRQ